MAGRSTGLLTFADRERRVSLRGRITRAIGACSIARLLVLATEHNELPIVIYIDSPGGPVADSLPILSTMHGIKCPIATFCLRDIRNSAVVIAACGCPGYRTAAPNAKFSFTPITGPGLDIKADQKFVRILAEILAPAAGRPETEVLRWLTEGATFTAQQAVTNGLIDSVAAKPLLPNTRPARLR